MPLNHVLLTRPKRKRVVLVYQPTDNQQGLQNTQYLKVLLPFQNFLLYKGLGGNNQINYNNTGSNIQTLKNVLTPNNPQSNQNLINAQPGLLVTCESFGAAFDGGLSIQRYNNEINSLAGLNIPFLVNAAIGDTIKNNDIQTFYNRIRQDRENHNAHIGNNPEDGQGVALIENYPALGLIQQNDNRKFFFNRSLYRNNQTIASFYKRGFFTPTLANQAEEEENSINRYVNGSYNSFFRDDAEQAELFIKICNDCGEQGYYLNQEVRQAKAPGFTRYFICQSDFYYLSWYYPLFDSLTFISGFKQNNIALQGLEWQEYRWPKQLTFNCPNPPTKMQSFLESLDYIICADSDGWFITDDTLVQNLTWQQMTPYVRLAEGNDPNRNIFYLWRFFRRPDNTLIPYEQRGNIHLNISYCDDSGDIPFLGNFFESIYDNPSQQTIQRILEVTGIDITAGDDMSEQTKRDLYTALSKDDLPNNNSQKIKVHLVSPLLGNIYRITNNQQTITLTQVQRILINNSPCLFGNLCDYSVFDLDQLDPPPGQQQGFAAPLEEREDTPQAAPLE